MDTKTIKDYLTESEKRTKIYTKLINEAEKNFRELNSLNMQGTLIQFEDFFDSNHLYSFKNWINGVIWDGPNVSRYWVDIALKYLYNGMPDPRGAIRIINLGGKVYYKLTTEYVPIKVQGPEDLDPITRKPKEEERKIWLVLIRIPRRFIEDAIEDDDVISKIGEPVKQQTEPSLEGPSENEEPEIDTEIGDEL